MRTGASPAQACQSAVDIIQSKSPGCAIGVIAMNKKVGISLLDQLICDQEYLNITVYACNICMYRFHCVGINKSLNLFYEKLKNLDFVVIL